MVFSVSMSEITVSTQRLSWHSFLPFTQSEVLMLMHQSFGSGRFQARHQLLVHFLFFIYLILTKWAGQPGRNTCICLFIEEWMESQR